MSYELLEEIRVDLQSKICVSNLGGLLTGSMAIYMRTNRTWKVRSSDDRHDLGIICSSIASFHTDCQAANAEVPLPKIAAVLATLLHTHCFKESAGRFPIDERRACFYGSI